MYVPHGSSGIYKNVITYSINNYELNTYYFPGCVPGTRDLTLNNKHSLLWCLHPSGEKHKIILSKNFILLSPCLSLRATKEKQNKNKWSR